MSIRDLVRENAKQRAEFAILQLARSLLWSQKKFDRELDVMLHYIDLQLDGPFWTDDD